MSQLRSGAGRYNTTGGDVREPDDDDEVTALRAEIERLREALRWYADPDNYDELSFQFEEPRPGDRAREALGDGG